jgi:hypothetical protein
MYTHCKKFGKPNNLKVFGSKKTTLSGKPQYGWKFGESDDKKQSTPTRVYITDEGYFGNTLCIINLISAFNIKVIFWLPYYCVGSPSP